MCRGSAEFVRPMKLVAAAALPWYATRFQCDSDLPSHEKESVRGRSYGLQLNFDATGSRACGLLRYEVDKLTLSSGG